MKSRVPSARRTAILSVLAAGMIGCTGLAQTPDSCEHVNPFIGTADNGHTFPGATVPFGLVQVSPETGNMKWRYCSGYNYADSAIFGFAQTHLNGTGCADLGDILLQPFIGDAERKDYRSRFSKDTEKASPGYYRVTLDDFGVDVELTSTARTAFHRYTFSKGPARVFADLQTGLVNDDNGLKRRVKSAEIQAEGDRTIVGHHQVRGWVSRHFSYVITFDRPFKKTELPMREGEMGKRMVLDFDLKPGEALQAKVALSTVDIDGAKANLTAENPGWDFEAIRKKARADWSALLAKVHVEGTADQKTAFYTSLYHLYIQPNNIADVDGRYRGADDKVLTSPSKVYYSTLSLWDTYRAANPLLTILAPERIDDLVSNMVAHQQAQGYLPIWTLWGKENHCMIANHAIPTIVDAYLKGFRGFDAEKAFEAIKTSLTVNHVNSSWDIYTKHGYYPFDLIKHESVSRTLECVYDDYCAAQMAKAMGKTADHEAFSKRADYYKNLIDPVTKFARGRDTNGKWRDPFDPLVLGHASSVGGDYTEGNAWQYTWHVQHDVEGLIDLLGGKEAFAEKLDALFTATGKPAADLPDVTGLIGQYAHGNEPSHHIAYLFTYAGRPWRTQELVREIVDKFYIAKPDGLCGNDDCGQMSGWYIFSAMGFYPVDPISGRYVFGAPQVPKVTLGLPGGKTFTVEAKGLSVDNKYVASIELNGKPCDKPSIAHQDIMKGGTLVFTMTGTKK
jgi:predicted alpha-1,2-mannosidase